MPNQAKPKMPETLADALAAFQKQVKTANREGTATEKRGNRETTRKYSTLEDLLKSLEPALELGISHSQTFDFLPLENEVLTILVTTLFFKNEKIESKLPLRDPKGFNPMHALGTAITYSRRYALGAIYGIGSEDDDDAMSLNDQPTQKQEKTINRSPQRGANAKQVKPSPVAHEMVTGKVAQASIPQSQKDALAKELQTLPPHGRNRVISSFRQEYKISSEKISEFITTPEHLSFIKSKIAEVESDSP